MMCATSGDLNYRYYEEIKRGDGKDLISSPTAGRIAGMLMAKHAASAISGELMTANNVIKGSYTE